MKRGKKRELHCSISILHEASLRVFWSAAVSLVANSSLDNSAGKQGTPTTKNPLTQLKLVVKLVAKDRQTPSRPIQDFQHQTRTRGRCCQATVAQ